MPVRAAPITTDLEPPWTNLNPGKQHTKILKRNGVYNTLRNAPGPGMGENRSTNGTHHAPIACNKSKSTVTSLTVTHWSNPLVQHFQNLSPPAVTPTQSNALQACSKLHLALHAHLHQPDEKVNSTLPVPSMHTETAFSAQQSICKDRFQLQATWVHISGFTGSNEQMHLQLEIFQEQYQLPLTAEAHLLIDKELEKVADNGIGHALDGQLLSSVTKRSILFPLQYDAVFAINPDSAAVHGTHEQPVYPFRMTSSLPAPPGHRGHMPTLIAQPWLVNPQADLQLVTRLYGFTPLHRYCLDDIYATCMLLIQDSFTRHGTEGIGMVQLLWHSPAVAPAPAATKHAKAASAVKKTYPLTLYVYLVATPMVNLHHMILTAALPALQPGYGMLDFYPCMQLTTRAPLAHTHLRNKCPDTPAWLLLADTNQIPLYQLLLALGISSHAILGIAYTTNGGQFGDPLPRATNILIHLSNQHDLDRLADRWYSSVATNCVNNGTNSCHQA